MRAFLAQEFCVSNPTQDTVRASLSGSEASSEKVAAYLRVVRRLLDGLPGAAGILAHHAGWQDGVESRFTNRFEPDYRSRNVFSFHRPETLAEWLDRDTAIPLDVAAEDQVPYRIPSTLYARLRIMPILKEEGLWPAQIKAIQNLEKSLAENRPRALIQMATGSGKTFTAVTGIYRMIKFAKAKRVLFLVDRANPGRQTLKEFQQYVSPYSPYKFTEEYIVQQMKSIR